MKRKGIKTILTLCMVFTMLFGNVLTVSAEEETSWWEDFTSKCVINNSIEVEGVIDEINDICDISYTYYEASAQVYCAVFMIENTYAYKDYGTVYNAHIMLFSEKPFTCKGRSININDGEQETQKEQIKDVTVLEYTYGGKTIYSTGITCVIQGVHHTSAPVYEIKTDRSIYNATDLLKAIYSDESELNYITGKPMSDSTLAEFDENLDFKNLRFKEINGTPVTHSITWGANEAYDDNTYVTIHCDIKYKPVLGALNTVYDYGWLTRFDEYPANNLSYSCLCTEPVESYFKASGIDWSSFNTQWVDTYYLQVLKYHPDTNTWTKSNEWYIDCGSQTTGMSTVYEYGTSVKNELTGEREKDKVGIGDGTSGEYVGGVIEDVYDEIGDTSDVSTYFQGVWKALTTGFTALLDGVGDLPKMVASVVSFLPPSVISLLGISVIVCIILRIVGR